jgi:TetR/AcrR family tetracycline transcriptional repressor
LTVVARPAARAKERPGRTAPLDEQAIIAAGVRVTRRVGLERLTMRAIADELGVTAMAAYYYIPSKDQLLERIAQAVVGQVEPRPTNGSWEAGLRAHAVALYETLMGHPGVASFLLDRPFGHDTKAQIQRGVEGLVSAGFSEHDAQLGWATYHTYMFGLMAMEARFRSRRRSTARDRAILVDVPSREFVEFGLETIIEGLRARLPPPRRAVPRRSANAAPIAP